MRICVGGMLESSKGARGTEGCEQLSVGLETELRF